MTREEAIKIFNTVLLFGKCDCPKEEIEECLKMAIEALRKLSDIQQIIESPVYIQEDVIRYKMICDIMGDKE